MYAIRHALGRGGGPIVQRSLDGRGLYFPRIGVLRNIMLANTRWGGGEGGLQYNALWNALWMGEDVYVLAFEESL